MKTLPKINAVYWLCLIGASIFGTNTGDYLAEVLGLGHMVGFPWLVVAFGLVFLVDRLYAKGTPLFFWAAIIVIRTAATNVGDAFGDFHIGFTVSLPIVFGLYVIAAGVYTLSARPSELAATTVKVSPLYWLCMILAGILGTVGGDYASFGLHLMPIGTTIVFGGLALLMIAFGHKLWTSPLFYWACLAIVRTAGTGAGDALAHLLGLPQATLLTGSVFIVLIATFYFFIQNNRSTAVSSQT